MPDTPESDSPPIEEDGGVAGASDEPEPQAADPSGDAADATGPDPLRFNRWMKRSTTGAVLTGVALGLQQALERRDQRPAFVIEAPGEPEDEDAPIRLHFDPDDPSNTVAIVRSDDAGHNSAARPVDGPEEDQPDR